MLGSKTFNFVLIAWIIIAAIFLGMGIVNAMENSKDAEGDDVSVSGTGQICNVGTPSGGGGCRANGCPNGTRHVLRCVDRDDIPSESDYQSCRRVYTTSPHNWSQTYANNYCTNKNGGEYDSSCVRDITCDINYNPNTDQVGGAPEMPGGGPVTGGGNPPASCYPQEPGSVAVYTKDQKYTVDAAGKITLKWSHDSRWGKSCKEQNNTYRVFVSVAASSGRCKKFNNNDYKLIYTRKADRATITEKIGTKTYKGDLLGSDKFKFEAGKSYCVLVRKMNGQVGSHSSVVKITTESAN